MILKFKFKFILPVIISSESKVMPIFDKVLWKETTTSLFLEAFFINKFQAVFFFSGALPGKRHMSHDFASRELRANGNGKSYHSQWWKYKRE